LKIPGPKSSSRSPYSIAVSAVVVVISVVGAWLFIESNRTTEVFLVTQKDLASGAPLSMANLDQVELSLFGLAGAYLRPETLLEGAYLERPIGSGEAIPLSAITTQDQNNWSNLVLTPEVPVSSQVGVGTRVSVWASPLLEFQSYGEPVLLAVDVEVVAIIEPEGGFAGKQKSLELRVPTDSIQYLLGAISSQSLIALTSTGGSS
jgi:uncharacterized protein YjbI with pentapeptide repeats